MKMKWKTMPASAKAFLTSSELNVDSCLYSWNKSIRLLRMVGLSWYRPIRVWIALGFISGRYSRA